MTASPQQPHLTPVDHHYFEWSTSKQNYQNYDDKQIRPGKTTITSPLSSSPTNHLRKKQKVNGLGSSFLNMNDDFNQSQQQTCYPFQAELTQKIDIECAGGSNASGQSIHAPTHHFTLSTVINVSLNGQTQKPVDVLPSSAQLQDSQFHPSLSSVSSIPNTELNLSSYLKDIDLTTFDTLILPTCPNPQDYLTPDGLFAFLMSDKTLTNDLNKIYQSKQTPRQYPVQQTYSLPGIQSYRYPYNQPNSSSIVHTRPSYASSATIETGTYTQYRQTSFPPQMTKYHSA